ncbi:MAG: hypothetical protein ABH875_00700 [Candidatus Omnitrophota bacterium]
MKIAGKSVNVFKIKNRRGYAAICASHLTEGSTRQTACSRMDKALRRKRKRTS